MEEKVLLFLDNLKKIHLFFGKGARQIGTRMAAKLAVKGMSFSAKDYEETVKTIKVNTKWYQKIRMNQKLQHLYYAQFAGQPHRVEQALALQKQMTIGGEESYRAAMYIKEPEQIDKIKKISAVLKKKAGMKWFSLPQPLLAVLAARSEAAEELAAAYENYYTRLTDLGWYSGNQGKWAALLLVVGTGSFDQAVWECVGRFSKAMEDEDKLDLDTYSVVCLLAIAQAELKAIGELDAICEFIDDRTDDLPIEGDLLLLAAQLHTSSEVYSDLPHTDVSDMDYLDLIDAVIDGTFDGSDGSGDGGSDGGGDSGGGD